MEYTTNLNLKKPDVNEYYNIEQENENKDLIDSAIGELNSQVGTETLTTTAQNCTGAINELNKKIGSIYLIKKNIYRYTIVANKVTMLDVDIEIIDGYAPVIYNFDYTSDDNAIVVGASIINNKLRVFIKNESSNTLSGKDLGITILYLRNE